MMPLSWSSGEEVPLMNQAARRALMDDLARRGVLLNSDTVGMRKKKSSVPTGGVEHPVRLLPNGPSNKRAYNRIRGVVRAAVFPAERRSGSVLELRDVVRDRH